MGMRRSWQRRRLSHAKESTSAPIRQRRVLSLLLALVLLPLGQAFQVHVTVIEGRGEGKGFSKGEERSGVGLTGLDTCHS